jgi:phosphoadenosine phosphosulfate reductase
MELSGVPFELVHNHTTMDAPETVYYIRSIPNIIISYPALNIHQLILKNGLPQIMTMMKIGGYLKIVN